MMDDSMEISSEHGHNMRDEDIDIDIDFTTGRADEDYILEDAMPHQTVDNSFLFEASPVAVNDDLMVDEEDETYHANEVNADFIPDIQNQSMADENAAVPFANTGRPEAYLEEHEIVDADHFEVASIKETGIADHEDATHDSPINRDLQPQDHHELTVPDDDHINVGVTAEAELEPEAEAPTTKSDETNPRPASPHLSPDASILREEPHVQLDGFPEQTDETSKHISDNDHLDAVASHEYEDEVHSASEETHHLEAHVLATPEILVEYQETEYALFSTSELDDPDSFFLSDPSILDSPISHFLKAIRDVIQEDLASDDELCLSIGGMGIEVEETSTSIQDITLRQVVTLYDRLLRNDGVLSPRPFCIQLEARPGFAKRFANLVAGAAEGKGLSELVFLTEHSNSNGESPHDAEKHVDDDGASIKVQGRQAYDDVQKEQEDVAESSDAPHPLNPDTDLRSSNLATEPVNKVAAEQNDALTTHMSKDKTSPSVNGDARDHYEEDDLIDYSDEEVDTPDTRKRSNETIHRGPGQEPVPSAADDSIGEEPAVNLDATDVEDYYQQKEASIENGIDYDEDNGEPYRNEAEAHEDGHEASKATDVVDTWEHEGNNQPSESQPQPGLNGKRQDVDVDHNDSGDEIEYDDEDGAEAVPSLSDEDLGLDVSPENPLDHKHASNSEVGKLTTAENGTSDKPLDASAIPDEVTEDEIDYDDDDEDSGVPETQSPLSDTKDALAPVDGLGKRQREDANLDVSLSMAEKDAKRRKS